MPRAVRLQMLLKGQSLIRVVKVRSNWTTNPTSFAENRKELRSGRSGPDGGTGTLAFPSEDVGRWIPLPTFLAAQSKHKLSPVAPFPFVATAWLIGTRRWVIAFHPALTGNPL
ncbi:uncharacterized protein LOC133921347 [Phragmites australis]|uniref:uncharacterized protein LOC133921347 n=1 Tax=Phragmites australis TaxID=29695 RepID=UPI002D7787B4|nr:uncharacterized protein LOC133921347 [Phragmites australis]